MRRPVSAQRVRTNAGLPGTGRTASSVLLVGTLLAGLGGCGRTPDGSPVVLAPPDAARGTAAVVGRVTFGGVTSPPRVLDVPCHADARPVVDDTVLVGEDGGLANVLVSLVGGVAVDGSSLPAEILDQIDCRYTPHVVGVVVNQPLRVLNSDPVFHNVHYTPRRNASVNFGLNAGSRESPTERTVRFSTPEVVRARCDVHPWMSAYVGVFANEHFAVSGGGGGFRIDGVPPGTYDLVAWHERFGEQRRTIEVVAGEPATVTIAYAPPGA